MKKRTLIYSLFALLIIFNVGCDEENIDLLPPSEVSNLKATPGEQTITLEWTNPVDDDFNHVEIFISPSDNIIEIPKDVISYDITGLENETEYTFTLKTVDDNDNISEGISVKSTLIDVLPPSEVTSLKATSGDQIVTLEWTNPEDDDFDHIEISISPSDNTIEIPKDVMSYDITGLENETEYTFTLKTIDVNGNISVGTSIISTPIDLVAPQEVTNFIAIGGEKKVTLNWTEPSDFDFEKTEISYSPGSADFIYVNKGTEEYIIEGLTIDTEYTFTIKAIDDDENKSTGITVSATPAYEIEGGYTCTYGEFWRIGLLFRYTNEWPTVTEIKLVEGNTYKVVEYFGYLNSNSWYFQIDDNYNISYPTEWESNPQAIYDNLIITCESNSMNLPNVDCDNSNFVTIDEIDGKHQLTMTIGYYTEGSGLRECYQVLEKIL